MEGFFLLRLGPHSGGGHPVYNQVSCQLVEGFHLQRLRAEARVGSSEKGAQREASARSEKRLRAEASRSTPLDIHLPSP